MLRRVVEAPGALTVVLLDSMSQIEDVDRGRIVIAASNAGKESGRLAAIAGCAAVIFNDAGIGKDDAGIAGLPLAEEAGIAGIAVGHDTAEISDAVSTWQTGIVTAANPTAEALGIRTGQTVQDAVARLQNTLPQPGHRDTDPLQTPSEGARP